jgi:arylsulfatase A-like enzyme
MKVRLLCLALALCPGSCSQQTQAAARPNVILICLDTVRADHLGCYGYDRRETTPFLDRLAEESILFENASASACWTKPSVPSFLTGTLPMQHGVFRGSARDEAGSFSDVLPEEALTLAEVFQAQGYQTAAFVRNAQLRAGLGFEQGFDTYQERAGDAREIRWKASDWLEERDAQRPFFLYLHLLDAHWPYTVPDEYAAMFSQPEVAARIRAGDWRALRDAVNDGAQELDAADLEGLVGLYDGSIRYMDDELGRLWKRLERDGLVRDTIVCVLSDHGEEFMEHGRLGHGHGLYEYLLHVPWILHIPGRGGVRHESQVSLLDLFPTLLSAAGLEGGSSASLGADRLAGPGLDLPAIAEHLDPHRYHVSWKQGGRKSIEIFEPLRPSRDATRPLTELDTRGRWEARLRVDASGELWVTRLRPAKEQDEERVELKGELVGLTERGFLVAGVAVDTSAEPELYGQVTLATGGPRALATGHLVKVRGELADGVLHAARIKLYGPEEELELELRGSLVIFDSGELALGGIRARVGADVELDFGAGEGDLGPEDVVQLYSGTGTVEERSSLAFDLERDPSEVKAEAASLPIFEDEVRLRLLRRLLETRVWGAHDRRNLSNAELDDLRAIGYVE